MDGFRIIQGAEIAAAPRAAAVPHASRLRAAPVAAEQGRPQAPDPAQGTAPRPLPAARVAVKRLMDILGASILLTLAAPFMLLVCLFIRLSDGGPALFHHERVGRGGVPFRCLKFRSMAKDADSALAALLARDPEARAEWSSTRKLRRDPRVTSIGRILRATSLDELPQLANVLRGDMSLVGPRPVVQTELDEHYSPEAAAHYLAVRPGITGLWQVSGRSDASYRERVALDIDYVRSLSLLTDAAILLKTLVVVVSRRGAY